MLQSLENVRTLSQHQRQQHGRDLDTNLFYDNCIHLLEERIDKLKPDTFLKALDKFDDTKHKARIVNSLLKAMRENKVDIRKYNFPQITKLIHLIAHYQKQDLHVFYGYILSCLET